MSKILPEDIEQEMEVSKSAVKREMLALQQMGEKIVALSDAQFKKIPLDEKLFDAISLARTITKNGGLKRQLQYVGKLMRHADAESIAAALHEIENGYQEDNRKFHLKERWRDNLLDGTDGKLSEFFEQNPGTDLQYLRQLLRNYKKAKTDDKKKQISRLVFKLIAEQIDQL